jgi:hypothetical protein
MRHTSVALSRSQTNYSRLQRELLMAKTATEPKAHGGDLRSRGSHDLGPIRPDLQASVFPRPLLGILAESTGLMVNKGPPRLGWPSAWRRQVARYRGLGDLKPSMRSSPWMRGAPQRKFSLAICAIRWRISLEALGRPPRQRPRDRYLQSAGQPLRRQRKTVCGWTIIRLSRHCGHQRDSKIQNRRSKRRKHGRRVRLRSSTAIWWRSAIAFNSSAVRVRGSLRAIGTVRVVGIAMKAGYRRAFEITNEFVWIKF